MNDQTTPCEKCNHYIRFGEDYRCPHTPLSGSAMIARDEIPGGIVLENYGPNPIRFDSHSQRRAYMEAHGLREKEKFCPMPGTDKDPAGIPNPSGYMDPKTLENARVLVSRNGAKAETSEFDAVEAGVMTGLKTGVISERDAAAVASGDPARSSRFHRRTYGNQSSK